MNTLEFEKVLTDTVQEYINNFDRFDSNPQLRINPVSLSAELVNGSDMMEDIADSDEAIEDAAAAQGMANQDSTDYQAQQNPDYYPVKPLLKHVGNTSIPDPLKIYRIATKYTK